MKEKTENRKCILSTMNNEDTNAVDQQIEQMISSEDSVVGIDAKKTHIIIIRKLMEIENRLQAIEKKLDEPT